MRHTKYLFAAATALALAACSDDVDETPVEIPEDTATMSVNDDDAYPVAGELDTEQQARYDAMDRDAASAEYSSNRDAMDREYAAMDGESASGAMASSGDGSSMADGSSGSDSGAMASDKSGTMSGASGSGESGMKMMPTRSQMDFAFLDRNSDGQLSVAEYAIWAVKVDPTEPKPNDSTKPYVTPEQINEAGQTFFYFDSDGSSYLSESEFQTARNSARTPG